jgi:glucosamine 6-phosphate synthetase-like amidotransferase/phosphosugar isomerase protein
MIQWLLPYSRAEIWSKLKREGTITMLKEIYEQPSVIKDTYRGRLHANEGLIQMSVEDNLEKFLNADRIIIVAWYIMACWVSC